MSGPDEAILSAQERAALAQLEARAIAADPRLADHLKGFDDARRWPARRWSALRLPDLAWLTINVSRVRASLRPMVWGPCLTVAGLALAVLGIAVGLVLSLFGVAIAGVGLALVAEAVTTRLSTPPARRRREGSSPAS